MSLLVLALLAGLGAAADGGDSPAAAAAASLETHFRVEDDPQFGDPRQLLAGFLRDSHAPGTGPQHFCVLGRDLVTAGAHDRTALVFWLEGNKLILWEGQRYPWRLVLARRLWDLARDVVDTPEQLRGSTYRLTRSWVEGMRRDCAAEGEAFAVVAERPRQIDYQVAATPAYQDEVDRVFASHREELRPCFEARYRKNLGLGGTVDVALLIRPNGLVLHAGIEPSPSRSGLVDLCITSRVRGWRFPARDGGGLVKLTHPLPLEPAGN